MGLPAEMTAGRWGHLRPVPEDIVVPKKGNNVLVFAEDMRFPRTKNVILGPDGREIGEEKEYPLVWQAMNSNLVVDWGRKMLLWRPFGLNPNSPSAAPVVLAGSVGNDGTSSTDNTLNKLKSELIGNANRISLTDIGGGSLDVADVTGETSGSNFWKIVVQFIFDTTDGNNTQTFAEFGLHDTVTLPTGTPPATTNSSGNMFARFVPTASFVKSSAFRVTVQWTIRA